MKYENYTIRDFLIDKEFIKWVKNPTDESNLFWSRWINEHENKRQALIDAIHIIRSIHFHEEKVGHDQIVRNLDHIISNKQKGDIFFDIRQDAERQSSARKFYWVAASIVLILSVVFANTLIDRDNGTDVISEEPAFITKSNPQGQKSTFMLPDSTLVVLNSESELTYPENFVGYVREVTLVGEAFFDVHKSVNRPFIVNSGKISTRVLGTSFNIKAFRNEETISISLNSGKVVIENGEAIDLNKVYLEPGEKYIYNVKNKGNKKLKFEPDEDLAWKDGILHFRQSDLNEFITSVERWYGVKVMVVGAPEKDWKINGRFKNESLRNVLESLSFARQIKYTMKDKNVVLLF